MSRIGTAKEDSSRIPNFRRPLKIIVDTKVTVATLLALGIA